MRKLKRDVNVVNMNTSIVKKIKNIGSRLAKLIRSKIP